MKERHLDLKLKYNDCKQGFLEGIFQILVMILLERRGKVWRERENHDTHKTGSSKEKRSFWDFFLCVQVSSE